MRLASIFLRKKKNTSKTSLEIKDSTQTVANLTLLRVTFLKAATPYNLLKVKAKNLK
jgi:hypothetical protein